MKPLLASLAAASILLVAPATQAASPPAAATLGQAPPEAAPALLRLVGLYGEPERFLTVYESGGELFADGLSLKQAQLKRTGADRYAAGAVQLQFHSDALTLGGERLPRRDFGAEAEAKIHAAVKADVEGLRRAALAASPPKESPARAADLVDLASIDPSIRFDIRYAGTNNFMGVALYERPGAYMQRPAAEALGRAHRALAAYGFGLLIHDGYRPWFVTKMFWDATPPESHSFVADPQQGSRHNRGSAVDLTLYDLKTGKPVVMPARYDEFSLRSYPEFIGGTTRQRWLRELLYQTMIAEGFTRDPYEWWHFDHRDWAQYGIGAVTFTELAAGAHK